MQSVSEHPPAVRVEDLWITFRATRERRQTLRGALVGVRDRAKRTMLIEALRGVSFEVPRGSVYGVVGRNGAGKTTVLRTIAGILPPTYGRVSVWGHVTPLLSLGVGFNRELTGRENILLGGLTAGLTAEEVEAHASEVEQFAGLGDALNFPMRTYSSGMFGRLAFSVAAHLNPEILLIDEALAAGDAAFKLKCMNKIVELCDHRDCTVLIVSHGLEVVKQLASRCVWLDRGIVRMDASADEVIAGYLEEERMEVANVAALEMSEARHATVRRIVGKSYSLSKRVALARMSRRSGPPIVVFTMGKTGSTAIARALADATGERVFQVFRLDADRLRAAERRYIDNQRAARADGRRGSAPFPGAHHLWETEYLLAHRPTPSAPWTVVTTTREPVAQAVSAFFHGRGHEAQRDGVPVSLLTEELVRDNWIRRPIRWFDREFAPAFGIDVYAEPFDPAAGHTVMETPSARVLLLRQEDLDVAPAALGAFLGAGRPVPVPARNEAATTDYAPAYREFVGHAQLPSELLDQAYTSRYAQHFYTRSEISRYRERWSDSGR